MQTLATAVRPQTLSAWLDHIDRVHPKAIDLGLERIDRVRNSLGLCPSFPVITVGGTNGKGSTCALLAAILDAVGYRVGCYMSPHLLRYQERVRIGRQQVSDQALCHAFARVEDARGEVPLTYFEFGTLAAMLLFIEADLDVAILEVGLGGRLDAVNTFDPDCAVITSVDLDHTDYLGETREEIAFEKAGIFRRGKPAVCAEPDVPGAMRDYARAIGAAFIEIDRDFGFVAGPSEWKYWGRRGERAGLSYPALFGEYQLQNASACLAALDELGAKLPVSMADVRRGLLDVTLCGRFQRLPGTPGVVLDVAHNPHAAKALAANLRQTRGSGRTYAVFAMLADKDIAGVVRAMKAQVDVWLVAGIDERRGASAQILRRILESERISCEVVSFQSPAKAFVRACELATAVDRIVVFGSFHTVAAVMRQRELTAD